MAGKADRPDAVGLEQACLEQREGAGERADRLVEAAGNDEEQPRLANIATDGETYGHHFKFGDLCLAHALEVDAPQAGFRITNYGEYLDLHPPEIEVEIDNGPDGEGTSWSCAHGVGRWSRDCGCHTGGEPGWNQSWRSPLRTAFSFLRDDTAVKFEDAGSDHLRDPWAARNDYIEAVLDHRLLDTFLSRHAVRPDATRIVKLLEMQRSALLMFTSCGWFFSDLAGIETIQVMRYAGRVMDLQQQLGFEPRKKEFLEILAEAKSNVSEKGNGADLFLRFAKP